MVQIQLLLKFIREVRTELGLNVQGLLTNDIDPDGDTLESEILTEPESGTINFEVEAKWTDLLQLVLITVIGAYFGGRSLEKRKK